MKEISDWKNMEIQKMTNAECAPIMPALDLTAERTHAIPLGELSALGAAFAPLATSIQTALAQTGGSGLYYVNTMGKQMFSTATGFIGSLKDGAGMVGGGQARMIPIAFDPATIAMTAMAATLVGVGRKLDEIGETQKQILSFLEAKERAQLQGNLNALGEVLTNFKYNWNDETYKKIKCAVVLQIKKEAEGSMVLARDRIAERVNKCIRFHSDGIVRENLKELLKKFQDYQLSLYLYAYSTFLEVILLGSFGADFLDSTQKRLCDYAFCYRELYTQCYDIMEHYAKSSVQAESIHALAAASRWMGSTIAKIPVISRSQMDENLIAAGEKLGRHRQDRARSALEVLTSVKKDVTQPFVENLRTINVIYNRSTAYLFDDKNLYLCQTEEA